MQTFVNLGIVLKVLSSVENFLRHLIFFSEICLYEQREDCHGDVGFYSLCLIIQT